MSRKDENHGGVSHTTNPPRKILLVACGDRKGLVHHVTGALFRRDLNIVSNSEFVDRSNGRFFMRTEFEGELDKNRLLVELGDVLPDGAQIKLETLRPRRTVVLATRESHCLGDLLVRCAHDQLNATIEAVISNHEILRNLTDRFGVPYHHVPHQGRGREEHEAEVRALIERYHPEYIVLAKYMRVLTPAFTEAYRNRIVNIHHSFLPAFIGTNPYQQAYERGVKIIGATAHFVNENLDEGPIIAQGVIPVAHSHNATEMRHKGQDIEKMVLAQALNLVLNERVFVNGNKTVIFD